MLPEESVVRALEPEQVAIVETRRPPALTIKPPEVNVEDAEPVTRRLDVSTVLVENTPCTVVVPMTVDEAFEMNPNWRVASPPMATVEEAANVPEVPKLPLK